MPILFEDMVIHHQLRIHFFLRNAFGSFWIIWVPHSWPRSRWNMEKPRTIKENDGKIMEKSLKNHVFLHGWGGFYGRRSSDFNGVSFTFVSGRILLGIPRRKSMESDLNRRISVGKPWKTNIYKSIRKPWYPRYEDWFLHHPAILWMLDLLVTLIFSGVALPIGHLYVVAGASDHATGRTGRNPPVWGGLPGIQLPPNWTPYGSNRWIKKHTYIHRYLHMYI